MLTVAASRRIANRKSASRFEPDGVIRFDDKASTCDGMPIQHDRGEKVRDKIVWRQAI